jgi:predicted secreted protein
MDQMGKIINIKFLQVLLIFSAFIGLKAYGDEVNKEDGTYLNLSVIETKQVEPDILIANLRYESESESAKEVQNKINQMMKKALSVAEKKENIEVSTEQYSVYKFSKPVKQGATEKELWKGSQSIVIKSKSTEDILALSGQLQEIGLVMSDLHYEVSIAKIEETRTSMVENAINKLLSHAKRVAGIIGLKEVKIKNINIEGDNRYPPVPYPKLMRTAAANVVSSITAPISAPGKIDITLNISATILLKN